MKPAPFTVEPDGSNDSGPCSCCGGETRTVWGFVHHGDHTAASYFVSWTLGHVPQHGAAFDLVVGGWGEGTAPEDRQLVALRYRLGKGFMVVDAAGRPADDREIVGRALARDEVIGTDLAREVFAIVDAVWLGDGRIAELTSP